MCMLYVAGRRVCHMLSMLQVVLCAVYVVYCVTYSFFCVVLCCVVLCSVVLCCIPVYHAGRADLRACALLLLWIVLRCPFLVS